MTGKSGKARQTLKLSIEGGHKADKALLIYPNGSTKRDLAANLKMSPTTITNFFARRAVGKKGFEKICKELKLLLKDVIESEQPQTEQTNIDVLVQQVRSQIEPVIRSLCGTMRVLDMDQPIELTGDRGIYTNVYILE